MIPQRVAFRLLDVTGNGELSMDVLEPSLKKFHVSIPPDLDSLFDWIDTDGDGYISFLDFLAATLPPSFCKDTSRVRRVFDILDRNADGFIDAKDLADAF